MSTDLNQLCSHGWIGATTGESDSAVLIVCPGPTDCSPCTGCLREHVHPNNWLKRFLVSKSKRNIAAIYDLASLDLCNIS